MLYNKFNNVIQQQIEPMEFSPLGNQAAIRRIALMCLL